MGNIADDTSLTEAFCQGCGFAWFELVGEDVGAEGLGGVRLNGEGRIIAISGEYACYECGQRVKFPMTSPIPAGIDDRIVDDLALVLPPLVTVATEWEMERLKPARAAGGDTVKRIDPSRAAPD